MEETYISSKAQAAKNEGVMANFENQLHFAATEPSQRLERMEQAFVNNVLRGEDYFGCAVAVLSGMSYLFANKKSYHAIGQQFLSLQEEYWQLIPSVTKTLFPADSELEKLKGMAMVSIDYYIHIPKGQLQVLQMRYPTLAGILIRTMETAIPAMGEVLNDRKFVNAIHTSFFYDATSLSQEQELYGDRVSRFTALLQNEYKADTSYSVKRANCIALVRDFLDEDIAIGDTYPHPKDQKFNGISLSDLLTMPHSKQRTQSIVDYVCNIPKWDIFWRLFCTSMFFIPDTAKESAESTKFDELSNDLQIAFITQVLQPQDQDSICNDEQIRNILEHYNANDIFELTISSIHKVFPFFLESNPIFPITMKSPDHPIYSSLGDLGKNAYAFLFQFEDISANLNRRFGNKKYADQFMLTVSKFIREAVGQLSIDFGNDEIAHVERYIEVLGNNFAAIQQDAISQFFDPEYFAKSDSIGVKVGPDEPTYVLGLRSVLIDKDESSNCYRVTFLIKDKFFKAKLNSDGKLSEINLPLPLHEKLSVMLANTAITIFSFSKDSRDIPSSYSRYLIAYLHGISLDLSNISTQDLILQIEQLEGINAIQALRNRGFKDLLERIDPIGNKSLIEQRKYSTSLLADIIDNN